MSLAASNLGRMIFSFPGTAYGFVSMMTGAMRGWELHAAVRYTGDTHILRGHQPRRPMAFLLKGPDLAARAALAHSLTGYPVLCLWSVTVKVLPCSGSLTSSTTPLARSTA